MSEEREAELRWVEEQIKERLSFYHSITSIGFERKQAPPSRDAVPSARSGPSASAQHSERSAPRSSPVPSLSPPAEGETLEAVRADLGECTRCALHEKRRHIVFGVGNPGAELMFVGEGPGYEEDRQGLPFVGPAGQLLTKIIHAIDRTREDVYITNLVKCRPPKNRDPEPEEVGACRPFLDRQIDSIRPKVICVLGRVAAANLLSTDEGITRLRGRIFPYRGAKLVPTYHPAYLLRNPAKKRETWEDMKLIRRLLDEQD